MSPTKCDVRDVTAKLLNLYKTKIFTLTKRKRNCYAVCTASSERAS